MITNQSSILQSMEKNLDAKDMCQVRRSDIADFANRRARLNQQDACLVAGVKHVCWLHVQQ